MRAVIRDAAAALGVPERGEALIAEMDARLARVRARAAGAQALYVTPSGVTAGPGTLVHHLLAAAGLDNFQSQGGWRPIPLERLAYEVPDLVAAASFGARSNHEDAWTPTRHPVARRRIRSVPVAALDGGATVVRRLVPRPCGRGARGTGRDAPGPGQAVSTPPGADRDAAGPRGSPNAPSRASPIPMPAGPGGAFPERARHRAGERPVRTGP